MPQYTYLCETCQQEADVIRNMADSDNPPSPEEFKHGEACSEPKYKKIIRYAPKKSYGANWSGRKGYW